MKYSLFYGLANGVCIVWYDNEAGKGDHKHMGRDEIAYPFIDVETLMAEFSRGY